MLSERPTPHTKPDAIYLRHSSIPDTNYLYNGMVAQDRSSSTYALCFTSSLCLSSTAKTSIGGLRFKEFARLHRFNRAIPMQG